MYLSYVSIHSVCSRNIPALHLHTVHDDVFDGALDQARLRTCKNKMIMRSVLDYPRCSTFTCGVSICDELA